MQHLVLVAHGLDQPRTIGVPVDAKQDLALFPGAVENLGQYSVVAGEDAALKVVLLAGEVAHPACRIDGSTFAAISRVRLTSTISSSSGGMLSSRSIMVETRPKRFKAAA